MRTTGARSDALRSETGFRADRAIESLGNLARRQFGQSDCGPLTRPSVLVRVVDVTAGHRDAQGPQPVLHPHRVCVSSEDVR
jgi:hypothetical protein